MTRKRVLLLLAGAAVFTTAAVLISRASGSDPETDRPEHHLILQKDVPQTYKEESQQDSAPESSVSTDTVLQSAPQQDTIPLLSENSDAEASSLKEEPVYNPDVPDKQNNFDNLPALLPDEPRSMLSEAPLPYGHSDFQAVPDSDIYETSMTSGDSEPKPMPMDDTLVIESRYALIPDDWRSLFPFIDGYSRHPDESGSTDAAVEVAPVVAAADEEPEPVTEPSPSVEVPALSDGPQILLTSPKAGGYYRSSLLLEGQCLPVSGAGDDGRIRSLSWKIPAMGEYTNTVFMDEEGRFQLDLMTAGLSGPQELILESEDFSGRKRQITLILKDGSRPPEILPDRDQESQSYGALYTVRGHVKDSYRGIPELEGLESLSYRLVPQDRALNEELLTGTVDLTPDGQFQLVLDMRDRQGPQVLQLTVKGKNGSSSDLGISLVPGSGDIPSFTMTPQDGRLVFDWDEVPGALEQNIYLSDRALEDPGVNAGAAFRDVKPPLVIDRSVNGRRYSARLEIMTDEGRFWSNVSYAVPLAPGTLSLRAEGGFEQIRLSWEEIPGAESFRIWRRTESESDFKVIAESISGSEYIDATATYGTGYFYRIEPAAVSGPMSYEVTAASVESPSEKITLASHYRQIVPEKIRVQGSYAYVAAGEGGFHIMDISTPQKPESIGFLDQKGVVDVYQGEEYLYLASGPQGFQIVNIEEPTRPYVVLSRVTPDALSVVGQGDLVYVADSLQGLQIFDVSDRQNPQRLSSLRDLKISQLALEGEFLYGAGGEDGLVMLDISNPYNPWTVQLWHDTPVYDVLINESYAYLACGAEGVEIYEILEPGNWRRISRFESVDARMIQLWDNFAMIADGRGGLRVVDVTHPGEPRNYGIFGGTDIKALAMTDEYALLADVSGMKVVRTYLFGQSFVQRHWDTPGRAYSVYAEGSSLWVADRQGGVSLYQAGSPDRIGYDAPVKHFDTEFAEDILIQSSLLYVADGPGGVKVFRMEDESPVDSYAVTGRARKVIPYGSQLAVVSSEEGLLILNTGESLSYAARFFSSDLRDAAFSGSTLFLGDNRDGLIVAEKIGAQFKEVQRFSTYSGIRQLILQGDRLYVLHRDGVTLLNIQNPENPVVLAEVPLRNAESIQLENGLLYLSEGIGGLSVYRVGRDEQLMKVSVCQDLYAVDAAPSGNWIYAADMDGVSVIRLIIPDWK